ncbi:MAG: type IIA DNA topoisomerase subunit B [Bacilli bacterium]|nr:type IIA DNA topoisomerase subunit B [Bacilli bacterium]
MVNFDEAERLYDADSIEIYQDLDAVRKRPGMYIGSTNLTGLHHLIWEIIDNSIDEAVNGYGNKITVILHKDGSCEVSDEGRGIPVSIYKETKIPTVQVIFTKLHAGGKFNAANYKTASGLHGVGATVTNALSEYLYVNIYRGGKSYSIKFHNGGELLEPLTELGNTNKHGTTVRFKPDNSVFPNTKFSFDNVCDHLREKAYLASGVHFIIKEEATGKSVEYYSEVGLVEYVADLTSNKNRLGETIYFSDKIGKVEVEIAIQWCQGDYGENILSYANDVRTPDGGIHEQAFKATLTKALNDWASSHDLLKGNQSIEGPDLREGITGIVSVKIPEDILAYESQTKTKLGTPEAGQAVGQVMMNRLAYYLSEHQSFAIDLIKKCQASKDAREAARRAKDQIRNAKVKKVDMIISDKLAAAGSKDYINNELFIVEGDSAGGSAKSGRDRLHQAILPLRGKPLNTEGLSIDRVVKNLEFSTLIQTIGAGVGADFDVRNSHYGKIIIMTDADTDGAHIQTLLLTFFYNFMKPLIDNGMVYIAQPPLYRVYKKSDPKKHVYCWTEEELNAGKVKIGAGYGINRYKGLGEMDADQLAITTMNKKTRQLMRVVIDDPLVCEKSISTLMGDDSAPRWHWIRENVNFDEVDTFIEQLKPTEGKK